MADKIKIFITSCETHEDAWRIHEVKLKRLFEFSGKIYDLTDNPDCADIIIIGNVREGNWGESIRKNPLINKYSHKCFSISDQDNALILHHGIFAAGRQSKIGRDRIRTGSYILSPDEYKNPFILNYRYLEDSVNEKQYLVSFIGRNCHPVRDTLLHLVFDRQDILIQDTSKIFDQWGLTDQKLEKQRKYFDILIQSKFALCPRGNVPNSYRLFEAMQLGIAPVIIADDFLMPKGPGWERFCIFVKERQMNELEKIIIQYEDDFQEMGQLARKQYEDYFSEQAYFNFIIDNCLDIMRNQRITEQIYWKLNPLYIGMLKLKKILNTI